MFARIPRLSPAAAVSPEGDIYIMGGRHNKEVELGGLRADGKLWVFVCFFFFCVCVCVWAKFCLT